MAISKSSCWLKRNLNSGRVLNWGLLCCFTASLPTTSSCLSRQGICLTSWPLGRISSLLGGWTKLDEFSIA